MKQTSTSLGGETARLRVLLVDDFMVVRQGVRAMLNTVDDIEIVGEASDGENAVHLTRELEPHVVLIDQDMPDGDGIEATRRLKQVMPEVEVIIMTDHLNNAKALEAIEAGATGYILKDIPAANLAGAVRSVCNGHGFLHPQVTRKLMADLGQFIREHSKRQPEYEGLTRREFEVLIELANGGTYNQIANKFTVTAGTVKTHVHHIFRKLGCRNRSEAVAYVLRKGLIK